MPIRFRCAYCNQLMGIARRKAGTVVSCPNCAGQVVVPPEDPTDGAGAGTVAPHTETEQPLFERSDFDDVFRSGGKKPAPPPAPAPAPPPSPPAVPATPAPAKPTVPVRLPPPAPMKLTASAPPPGPVSSSPPPPAAPPRLDFSPNLPAPAPAGFVVSPSMSTLLSVAVIVALALAFTAGLLVGRFYLQPLNDEKVDPPPQPVLEGHRETGSGLPGLRGHVRSLPG